MTLHKNIPAVNKKIEDLIKNDFGTITSTLTNRLGPEAIGTVESIVTNSYNEARTKWSAGSLPVNPKDFIWQFVTDNTSELFCHKILNHYSPVKTYGDDRIINLEYPYEDEVLSNKVTMLFACSHPINDQEINALLCLKIMGGYSSSDIARILSKNEVVVLNKLEYAKEQIIEKKIPFAVPGKYVLRERTVNLLKLITYIFELGYNHPDDRIRVSPEVCNTAINLCEVLTKHPKTNIPESRALMAYMLFCGSRLNSIKDKNDNVLKLQEQERTKWDRQMIKDGIEYLYQSASGKNVDKIHLMAGVEAIHSTSPDYKSTNWNQIVSLYQNYLQVHNCPQTELEMAFALSKTEGPKAGIEAVKKIKDKESIKNSTLFGVTLGNLYLQLHKYETALTHFKKALKNAERVSEKTYLNSKIHICQQRIRMTKRYKHGLSF